MPTTPTGQPDAVTLAGATAAPSRCLIVDDHPAVRLGLEQLLAAEPGLDVVGVFSTAEEALGFAVDHAVDVAVVDYQLGGRSGLWLSRRLARLPDPPGVLVYSAYCNHLLAAACVVAQADSLVSKSAVGERLITRVHEVAAGEARLPVVPPVLADSIGRRFDHCEQAIFGLMASGVPPAEVAATLRLDATELDGHLSHMLSALQPPRTEDRAA